MRAKAMPTTTPRYAITPYERRHRSAVLDLLFRSNRVHTHLDWHDTPAWLENDDITLRLAWNNGDSRLAGIMAASAPQNVMCWLRLVAVMNDFPGMPVLSVLWDDMRKQLRAQAVETVNVLIINDWLESYVADLGFRYVEDIITLYREGPNFPVAPPGSTHGITVRPAEYDDLAQIVTVDHIAFDAPWRLAFNDLWQARRMAASCTVAVCDESIVGYQLSTLFRQSAHLARLAVNPAWQQRGIGSVMLHEMLGYFLRRGVRTITVNTQSSNTRSQRLYERFGFKRNGHDLPVWEITL